MDARPDPPNETDVAVIGGGIAGTSAAYFLATETDRDVALFEKEAIAAGSTGDSSAILRHHYGPDAVYSRTAAWSHEFYREFEARTGASLAYDTSPRVHVVDEGTDDAEHALAGLAVLRDLDLPAARHDDPAGRYPALDVADRDFAVADESAAYSDGTDAATGLARAADAAGATLLVGTAVEGIETDADGARVTGVRTADGVTACDAVAVCAGPWTPRLLADVGVDLPVVPTRQQVLVLDPPPGFSPADLPTTSLDGDGYVRPDFGGRVLVATHERAERVDPDRYDDAPDEAVTLDLIDRLVDLAPSLADAGVAGRYCGVYAETPDRDFLIDAVGPDGCVVACGLSGHGFKHGPAIGRIVTDLVTAGRTDLVDRERFALDRL
jgi:glycine/D-amino acid oxidase-like deaminating enzyme